MTTSSTTTTATGKKESKNTLFSSMCWVKFYSSFRWRCKKLARINSEVDRNAVDERKWTDVYTHTHTHYMARGALNEKLLFYINSGVVRVDNNFLCKMWANVIMAYEIYTNHFHLCRSVEFCMNIQNGLNKRKWKRQKESVRVREWESGGSNGMPKILCVWIILSSIYSIPFHSILFHFYLLCHNGKVYA